MSSTLHALCSLLLVALLGGCCTTRAPRPAPPRALAKLPNRLTDPLTIAVLEKAGVGAAAIHCNGRVAWFPQLQGLAKRAAAELAKRHQLSLTPKEHKKDTRLLLGYLVRLIFQYVGTQNLGVMQLSGLGYRDEHGKERPLLVFRSGVTTDPEAPDSCLRSLLGAGHVRHVVNLYAGSFPLHQFIKTEKTLAEKLGASHHDSAAGRHEHEWRDLIKTAELYEKNKKVAMERVAELLRKRILRPGGKAPRGNIYFHCGGGMHRSGMVFGVLRRCLNGAPMALVEAEYKRHVAYRSPTSKGGYEPLNVRFIREFDCSLLDAALPSTKRDELRARRHSK